MNLVLLRFVSSKNPQGANRVNTPSAPWTRVPDQTHASVLERTRWVDIHETPAHTYTYTHTRTQCTLILDTKRIRPAQVRANHKDKLTCVGYYPGSNSQGM